MWQTYAPNKKFYGSQECLGPEDTKQMLLKNPGRKNECAVCKNPITDADPGCTAINQSNFRDAIAFLREYAMEKL
ncbi:unnamed protein product [Nippostrongylus brasiliensis]|uniref:Uncharacterized protein n=1 Tax=Nippostrongylus brasiliensis TaxID=27835 RepID=A0A0N4YS28_NIPBR|nr:unnamed protein product [Nippostrongylus brasiliensis]